MITLLFQGKLGGEKCCTAAYYFRLILARFTEIHSQIAESWKSEPPLLSWALSLISIPEEQQNLTNYDQLLSLGSTNLKLQRIHFKSQSESLHDCKPVNSKIAVVRDFNAFNCSS